VIRAGEVADDDQGPGAYHLACLGHSSQQVQELLPADTGGFDDLVERPSRKVAGVHRHDHAVPMVWVAEDVVTSFDAVEAPAAPFQRAHRAA
jgi:hypothetical protein